MPEVRRLARADLPQWLRLRSALFPRLSDRDQEGRIIHLLADPLEAGFGAFRDRKLVGFIEVSERPWGEGCETAPVAWIESILVLAGRQRDAIARRLVDATANWSRARGLQELASDVLIETGPSLSAHLNWGIEETMSTATFRKRL